MEKSKNLFKKQDYLSKDNTFCIKGVFAIAVLIHHLYQYSGLFRSGYSLYLGYCFQALGLFAVATFFFLSGYGLAISQGKSNIKGFVKQKIVPFYLIIVIFTVVYAVCKIVMGETVATADIIRSLTFGGTIISNGWYLQVQLLYYIFFFLVIRLFPEKRQLAGMIVLHILYIAYCVKSNFSVLLYERTFIFVFGIWWCKKKENIDKWLDVKENYVFTLLSSVVLFAVFYLSSDLTDNNLMSGCARGISYFFFIILVMCLAMRINIRNSVTMFLGEISLEIYILQGIFLKLFQSNILYINNTLLYVLCTFLGTLILSVIIHPVVKKIYKCFRKSKN